MARRKKSGGGGGDPAWLITFSDLMTLLLTFFVLLLSMAVIDERAKRVVLGSVSQAFGFSEQVTNILAESQGNKRHEPGAMQGHTDDLAALRDMKFDDVEKDLDFRENKYVQILSINSEVLFVPGGTTLSQRGVELLDRIVPYLQRVRYPLLVAGHTAVRREEESDNYTVRLTGGELDSTWPLSYNRAFAVYSHLKVRGIPSSSLSLEAFGEYHPRYTNNTPEGRQKNRRVELVLDKRNRQWIEKVEALREKNPEQTEMFYKGFRFDLTMPGSGRGNGGRP